MPPNHLTDDMDEMSNEFKQRLESELSGTKVAGSFNENELAETRAYEEFKEQYLPKHLSLYEKLCQFSENTLPFKPDDKKIPELQRAISICHLNTTDRKSTHLNSSHYS